tara:strand:+ start:20 stop:301 length:282 start_codon:yes stop_codon:yes gene_type:complete
MKKILLTVAFGIISSTATAEYVCHRLEGCELFPEARTVEEYCPACVWEEEKEEVVLSTPKRSSRHNHEVTVCDHWNPITSEEDGPTCRTIASN